MAGWRELKRNALKDIHQTFEIPAVYLTSITAAPVRVNVRLHQRHMVNEQDLAEWGNAASLLDTSDKIIFQNSEVGMVHSRSYVIFGPDEIFYTGPTRPVRDEYTVAEVTAMSKAEIEKLLPKLTLDSDAYEGVLK